MTMKVDRMYQPAAYNLNHAKSRYKSSGKQNESGKEEPVDHGRPHRGGCCWLPSIFLQNPDVLGRVTSLPAKIQITSTHPSCRLLTHGQHHGRCQGGSTFLRRGFAADIGTTICQDHKGPATRLSTRRPRGDDNAHSA